MTAVNKATKSIEVIWINPINLLNGGISFYVVFAKKTNSSESSGEIVSANTTASKITGLDGYTEYDVGVVAVDGYGTPFKSADISVKTEEGGELHYNDNRSIV